jgi:type IV fimbrial biogenesis protein FimT
MEKVMRTSHRRMPGARIVLSPAPANVRGFTMVELIITLVVIATLATIAFPAMSNLMVRHRVQDAGSDIYAALIKARSEALKRNTSVSLQPISGSDWTSGWEIPDPANAGSYVDVHQPVAKVSITRGDAGASTIVYQSTGRISGGVGPLFTLTATSGSYTYNSCVRVDPSGRPYTLGTSQGTSC